MSLLRRLGGAALLGATAWVTADAAADTALYLKGKSLVEANMHANDRFTAELGAPLTAGPWYNSSVLISADGHLATVTLPVRGSRRSSDVTVRIVRKGGLRSTLLYNIVGGAEWEVLVMQAVIGMGPGGIPRSMSLLEQEVPDMAAAAAAAMGHGERPSAVQQAAPAAPAAAPAAQQQQQQAAPVRQGER